MSTNYIPSPSTLSPGSIVDTYLRDSGGEKQDRSVPPQLEAIQLYCVQHKLQLRHVFKDVAKSDELAQLTYRLFSQRSKTQ